MSAPEGLTGAGGGGRRDLQASVCKNQFGTRERWASRRRIGVHDSCKGDSQAPKGCRSGLGAHLLPGGEHKTVWAWTGENGAKEML